MHRDFAYRQLAKRWRTGIHPGVRDFCAGRRIHWVEMVGALQDSKRKICTDGYCSQDTALDSSQT